MLRRWSVWALCSAVVAVVAFAPFRHDKADSSTGAVVRTTAPASGGPAAGTPGTGAGPGASDGSPGADGGLAPLDPGAVAGGGGSTDGAVGDPTAGGSTDAATTPPTVSVPTKAQLAVLGPLIQAMDTGQRAGTPLVLGIATSLVATGLPSDSDVPAELRPVVSTLADLIATPGARVNDVTAQNSLYLAQLDKALGQLAFANPALNETVHEVADQLAALGRTAAPTSPPAALSLSDLSVLLTFFLVE